MGHRGIPALCPENTLVSLLEALKLGADGLETDVRFTADGVPILMHDESLSRMCGVEAKVSELTLSEIKKLRVDGQEIPTLEEFLRAIPPGKWINLELKETGGAELVVEMAQRIYEGELIFSSFKHETISKLKSHYPHQRFGYLFDEGHRSMSLEDVLKLFENGAFSAHLPVVLLSENIDTFKSLVSSLKRLGVKIVLWTVNSWSEIESVGEFVDFIITDDVRTFLKARAL